MGLRIVFRLATIVEAPEVMCIFNAIAAEETDSSVEKHIRKYTHMFLLQAAESVACTATVHVYGICVHLASAVMNASKK